jgi:formylglycine-generating enzyme required for sulfatase activity
MATESARAEIGLLAALTEARAATDALFDIIRPESLYERPVAERHRLIFYLGHLEAFDWNLICRGALDVPSFHAAFDRLFAFGIDPDSSDLPSDLPSDWPAPVEVGVYNAKVRSRLDALLGEAPEQLLHVAIEHRLMHAETFAYLLHNLAYSHKRPGPPPAPAEGRPVPAAMVRIPAGIAVLGAPPDGSFGWDNEFKRHEAAVGPFSIGRYKVSNGQFLEFVEQGSPAPHFWSRDSGRWFYRGMFGTVPLPLDWPVYVTHEQARAYAAWKGMRLPTEPEFHRAAYAGAGTLRPDPARDNYDFRAWDPIPVHASPENENAHGVVQAVGNGWEWTATEFGPFEGFRTFDFYPGYSAPFFDGKHFVLKGASQRTAARLTRPAFRNWFRASYPYAYSTFRLAAD